MASTIDDLGQTYCFVLIQCAGSVRNDSAAERPNSMQKMIQVSMQRIQVR